MTTRAASAAFNHQAKQELVKLLFGKHYYRKGPIAHRMLDHSIYTYEDLRSAYLKRVQEIHPDKHISSQNRLDNQQQFVQLQEAWNRFEEVAKVMRTASTGENRSSNFTLFGVGCSFADSEQERNLRNEFTDQACRGWLSAGLLVEKTQILSSSSSYDPLFSPEEDDFMEKDKEETKNLEDAKQPGKTIHALEFLRRSQR